MSERATRGSVAADGARACASLLLLAASLQWGCSSYAPPEGLRPEELAHVRFTRDESDLFDMGPSFNLGFGLQLSVHDMGDACPERGLLGYRMRGGRDVGGFGGIAKGETEEFDVAANRRIFFDTYESEWAIVLSVHCSVTAGWIPAPGHSYDVTFTVIGDECTVVSRDRTTGEEVRFFSPADCSTQAAAPR